MLCIISEFIYHVLCIIFYSVWLQLLNRRQTELRLIVLPLSAFYVSDIQGGETSVDCPPSEAPMGYLLLQEKSEDWINVR